MYVCMYMPWPASSRVFVLWKLKQQKLQGTKCEACKHHHNPYHFHTYVPPITVSHDSHIWFLHMYYDMHYISLLIIQLPKHDANKIQLYNSQNIDTYR